MIDSLDDILEARKLLKFIIKKIELQSNDDLEFDIFLHL